MKVKINFLIFAVMLILPFVSCKSTAQNATSTPGNNRMVVSFISKGNGINNQIHEQFEKFVQGHPKKPIMENYRWGREGEIDYCLQLKELSKKDQVKFVDEVKKIIGNSDVVLLTENAPCVHKK